LFIVSGFSMASASPKCPPGSSWGPAGCVSDNNGGAGGAGGAGAYTMQKYTQT